LGLLALSALVAYAAFQIYFFGDIPELPPKDMLWTLGREPSVRVLDRDGNLLAERGPRYGDKVEYGDLPTNLVNAVIATEDRRFYDHTGVDGQGLVRAMVANWRAGHVRQGGSTITQQLVKTLFLTRDQTLKRKLQEMQLAHELEKRLEKPEILTLYLNRQYFGGHTYGVNAAAKRYFDKPAHDVTLSEAAMLAGLLKAPSRLDPSRNISEAQERARVVLMNMQDAGFITQAQMKDAVDHPAVLRNVEDDSESTEFGYIVDVAVSEAHEVLPVAAPDLVIRTTIDSKLQHDAEAAIESALTEQGRPLHVSQSALLSLSPDGAVRVLVGGRSYDKSKFNRATQALRQPGSAFKPLVYAAALESGVKPTDVFVDQPVTIGNWTPANYEGGNEGPMTVTEAFKHSVNTISAQIVQQIGADKVIDVAHRFGVTSEFQPLPSIALGTQEVTLWDLVGAYAVFLNNGDYRRPHIVEAVTDTRGEILYAHPKLEPKRVYSPRLAKQMRGLMWNVVNDGGTGVNARLQTVSVDVVGKTGTSSDWRDAWFVGFSSRYVTGIWFGNDDNSPMRKVQGGGLPAETWRRFMEAAHADVEPKTAVALDIPAPSTQSPRSDELSRFYSKLAQQFAGAEGE
jgi:penicillin-binding protein 1A